ncbi:Exodeoxyribonuclease VII large subunit [Quadrisphaera granulorum]|uniref:Exodeoxyribonuclease 7 large subunit n=1 Tax=Quadrisphaera granulorum TaxID=317664 RepID=A0A316AGS1_9ACTN|nr:exodeoxyribonuclease VII large subunit [Quadrisphaera granulorum]PWJ56140.1 exodeoxyribonuclease VII large subunit [Quadrisphaera granulorum]SZE94774.1 Exodeoxyribonuclease VII large subunit [Quadrisphaera granulorum]
MVEAGAQAAERGAGQKQATPAPALPPTAAQTSAEHPWPVRLLTMKISDYVAKMPQVWVEGQVVQATRRPGTTTAYLTLRDTDVDMSLPVSAHVRLLDALPGGLAEGARVVVRASPEFWTKRGVLQLQATDIRPVGVGELLARIEHLKRVLASEGLLDEHRKKPLPFLPRCVGLVCGRASAAERDVVRTASDRWPGVRFEIRQVAVQGTGAVSEVSAAVAELDDHPDVDVIVVARGGGSLEDLLPFSNEALCRAVAACATPVVSAIGHEVDNVLLDLVADVRASTPTDAGRRVVPAVAEELAGLEVARSRLRRTVLRLVDSEQTHLAQLRSRPVLADPRALLAEPTRTVTEARERGRRALEGRLREQAGVLAGLTASVRALSPAAVLERGYAVLQTDEGQVVRSPEDAPAGEWLRARLARGSIVVEVVDSEDDENFQEDDDG